MKITLAEVRPWTFRAVCLMASGLALLVLARSGGEAYLTWSDTSPGETGFRIERSAAGGTFEDVGTAAPANATSALVRGLMPGTVTSRL